MFGTFLGLSTSCFFPIYPFWNGNVCTMPGGFPGDTVVKNMPANGRKHRRHGSIPEWGRSPGVGNGNPLTYFCLENPIDRAVWWATIYRAAKSWIQLSTHTHTHTHTHTLCLSHHCYLEAHSLSGFTCSQLEMNFASGWTVSQVSPIVDLDNI